MQSGAAPLRLKDWFVTRALPLWASASVDAAGGFYESLSFEGAPIPGRRRCRVQCRQIHTFTEAALRGWFPDGEAIAARAFDRLISTAIPSDGARGSVHSLDDNGAVDQRLRDLYDQAFLLLACAARIKATNDQRARLIANNTLAFLDREFGSPHGGYRENDRGGHPRRQNPHMHLFEALMALFAATGDAAILGRANAVEALFRARFFDSRAGVLREYFNDDWSLIDKVSDRLEPGHMAEWIALLRRFERLTGETRHAVINALYEGAMTLRIPGEPFLPDTAILGAVPGKASRRLWPQTELLRATIELGKAEDAAILTEALFASYFNEDVEGLWCDAYDDSGEKAATSAPASILYHLLEAACCAADAHQNEAA